jgi:serine/threonine protein kinase
MQAGKPKREDSDVTIAKAGVVRHDSDWTQPTLGFDTNALDFDGHYTPDFHSESDDDEHHNPSVPAINQLTLGESVTQSIVAEAEAAEKSPLPTADTKSPGVKRRPPAPTDSLGSTSGEVGSIPQRWKQGKLLGRGGFGSVYEALDMSTGKLVACKQLVTAEWNQTPNLKKMVESLEIEIKMLQKLRHPNVVAYIDTERTIDKFNLYIELVDGGSVYSLISRFGPLGKNEGVISKYIRQAMEGLKYLHQHRVIHRDLKAANMLLTKDGVLKIADFGTCAQLKQCMTMTGEIKGVMGSPCWMAPEVLRDQGYGRKADIWSIGCTLIEMATGQPPWSNLDNHFAVLYKVANSKDLPPMPDGASEAMRSFLEGCFHRDPSARKDAEALLNHEFCNL